MTGYETVGDPNSAPTGVAATAPGNLPLSSTAAAFARVWPSSPQNNPATVGPDPHTIASSAPLIVPPHFWVEMANALLRGVRLAAPDVIARLERLGATGIDVADRGMAGILEAVALAERHRLTVYDAAYLQLALDVDGTLATFDDDLRRAATSDEVPLLV